LKSCAFTGHRPDRYFFKYNELHPLCEKIKTVLLEQAKDLYSRDVRRYYVGGALGADMWAGEAVVALKSLPEYKEAELVCVLPYEGYDSDWNDESHDRLQRLMSACIEAKAVSNPEDKQAFKKRNQYLVDHSDCLVAVYDEKRGLRSGTKQTVEYAKKLNREIIFIHPETAAVSYFNT